jgi:c(7)-type cytochrome triheme protein
MWNPHSVMFEVAWCVTLYTTVLALEFSPMVLERFRLRTPLRIVGALTVPLVIAGVLLSTLHQSSLGTLYVIIPQKLHGLWYSSLLPVLFFLSAIAAGLSMVILESFLSARAFGRHLELDILQDLGRVVVVVLALYIVIRLQNLASREAFSLLLQPGPERFLFGVEVGFGALVPGILLALPAVRRDRGGLFCAALLVVLGFVLNRLNVAITGLGNGYFPSALELAVTGMLVALSFIAFSLAVKHLQVFPQIPLSTVSSGPLPRPAWVAPITRGALASLGITMLFGALWLNFSGIPLAAAPRPQIEREYTPELRLPSDQVFPAGEDSPGRVLFSHESHADTDKPNCVVCHTGAFSILREERASGYRYGDQMHEKTRCGLCHNNEDAFEVEDNCEVCHVGD